MAGIIPPSAGGVTTPETVVSSVRPKPPAPNRNNIPDGITKINNRDKVKFLIGLGYALNEKEGWNARAKAAWKNMMAARVRDIGPQEAAQFWSKNSKLSRDYKGKPVTTVDKTGGAGSVDRDASVPTAVDPYTAAVAQGGAQTDAIFAALGKRLGLLKPPTIAPIPLSLASRGIQEYTPDMLDSLAGTESYDSTISSLQGMLDQNTRDTAANIKQIQGWYGQVGQSLKTAAQRDQAIQAASLSSVQDAARAIASSIGGEANPGASMAAQAGAQGAGLVQAMGAANDEFNSDIGPLIAAEGVGRTADAQAEGSRRAQEIAMQIAQTRSEKTSSRGDALLKLAQLNNELNQQRTDRELSIRQANQGLTQQNFQNKQGLYGLAASLGLAGVDSIKGILSLLPEPTTPKPGKKPTPPSPSSLSQSDANAWDAVNALKQGGLEGRALIQPAIKAINSTYGITSQSTRASREAAFRTAQRLLPGVKVDRRWFGLG